MTAFSWISIGLLQKRDFRWDAIEMSGRVWPWRYESRPTSVQYFHDNFSGFTDKYLWRRPLATGVDDMFGLVSNSLLLRPRTDNKRSIKKGWDSSKEESLFLLISIPRNMLTSPLSVKMKISRPFCIEWMKESMSFMLNIIIMQLSTYVRIIMPSVR